MAEPALLAELLRGGRVESQHFGHAAVVSASGELVAGWGDVEATIYPRSSVKMIQALPLVESGAAADLSTERLALACASHRGEAMHTARVASWLADLGLDEGALECGAQPPGHRETRHALIRAGDAPCALHNNCSGKHAGFLMAAKAMRAPLEGYVEADHPVQRRIRDCFEEVTGQESPGYGIDGCSAPNFATTLRGVARAMAQFAGAGAGDARGAAMGRLVDAMKAHPALVAGTDRSCTNLISALPGRGVVKLGAEGVYIAILPEQGLGVALKVIDGATRASTAAIAALLARLGALDPEAAVVTRYAQVPQINFAGRTVGHFRAALG